MSETTTKVTMEKSSIDGLIGDVAVQPSPTSYDELEVVIQPDRLIGSYAKALIDQTWSVNEPMAARVGLSEEELTSYLTFLIVQRVLWVNGEAKERNKLQLLWIPAFADLILTEIGTVHVRDFGITIVPKLNSTEAITFDEAKVISDKLGRFAEYITMFTNQFPRRLEGDLEVMSTALIDGYLKSFTTKVTPSSRFIAAYLGNQLRAKEALRGLFRVSYEPIDYINQTSGSLVGRLV